MAWPVAAALLFAAARYLAGQDASLHEARDGAASPQNAARWFSLLAEMGMWLSLGLVLVRVLGEVVFLLFRKRKGREAPSLMRDIFSLVAYVVCLAFILKWYFPTLSFGALLSGSAVLGIIVGLALQDTLGNLFAGISLHADRPFQVGDVITVGLWTGIVESITWRAVKIRTFSNHVVLVSNSQIAKEAIEVCPHDNPNARLVFFNTTYTDSPARVIEAVREVVREVENVRRYMTPVVRIRNFGESSIDYEVKYWLEDYARYNDTDATIRQRIWYTLRRNQLSFAYPTRTVFVERRTPGRDGQDGRERLRRRLSKVEIFAPLSAEELARLAESTERHTFAPGETIIRAGEDGDSMFVLNHGRVEVQLEDRGRRRVVNTLGEGTFFGEMALLTGEPRTADVVAVEETEVLEIGHSALQRLFDSNPELAEKLSLTIAERRRDLNAQTETEQAGTVEPAGLLSSIKRFFRLD